MQIRTKLTLQFIVLVAGILLLSLCFIYFKFKQIVEAEFYDSLRSKALMTAEMVLHDEDKLQPLESPEKDTRAESLPFRENVIIYNAARERIFAFNRKEAPLADQHFQAGWASAGERHFQRGEFYGIGISHKSRSGLQYYIVAESIFNPEDLRNLRNILIITFFLGIGIVAAGGWLHTGQAMSPVARIVGQAEGINPSDLSARLEAPNHHDEISRLVMAFNRLLDRIEFAFRMQKSFISNVSHELKNPLSVIISQLEIALDRRRRSAEEYRDTLSSVLEDTHNLSEIADKMLQLARLNAEGGSIQLERVRLDETMLQTRAALLRLRPDYHIAFDLVGAPECEEDLCVNANEALLRSAFLNLMENGCKFSPDKTVDVKIHFHPQGQHHIEITDRGPGIPSKDLQLIFQPFYRSSQNIHIRGSGIGLSLVDSILKLHRIALNVASAQGKGTTFKLSFPALST
jgi:signal transduction histidine kinase